MFIWANLICPIAYKFYDDILSGLNVLTGVNVYKYIQHV